MNFLKKFQQSAQLMTAGNSYEFLTSFNEPLFDSAQFALYHGKDFSTNKTLTFHNYHASVQEITEIERVSKKFLHPSILKSYPSFTKYQTMFLVTEYAVPLSVFLKKTTSIKNPHYNNILVSGLAQIVDTLSFIHNSCNGFHGSINMDSIFVTASEEFKVFNFYRSSFVGVSKNVTENMLVQKKNEDVQNLVSICLELLKMKPTKQIVSLQEIKTFFLNKKTDQNYSKFLYTLESVFTFSPLDFCTFLTNYEKYLITKNTSSNVLAYKVLPKFNQLYSMKNSQQSLLVEPYIVEFIALSNVEISRGDNEIKDHLTELLKSRNTATKINLIKNLNKLIILINDKKYVSEVVFPGYLACFTDGNPELYQLCINSIGIVCSNIDIKSLELKFVPFLIKLMQSCGQHVAVISTILQILNENCAVFNETIVVVLFNHLVDSLTKFGIYYKNAKTNENSAVYEKFSEQSFVFMNSVLNKKLVSQKTVASVFIVRLSPLLLFEGIYKNVCQLIKSYAENLNSFPAEKTYFDMISSGVNNLVENLPKMNVSKSSASVSVSQSEFKSPSKSSRASESTATNNISEDFAEYDDW